MTEFNALQVGQLKQVLLAEEQASHALEKHLGVIEEALSTGQIDDLEKHLNHESGLLAKLDALAKRKHEILKSANISPNNEGLRKHLQQIGDTQLTDVWQRTYDCLQSCREKNRSNAAIVKQSQRQVEAALNLLRGDDTNASAYNQEGQTKANTKHRSLGQA